MTLKYQDFKAFLSSKENNNIAGISSSTAHCPLAEWLRATTGTKWRIDQLSYWEAKEDSHVFNTPRWASQFIDYVDCDLDQTNITILECLDILTHIQP